MTEHTAEPSAVEPEATTLTFTVAPEAAGTRLDAYLAAHVPAFSRTRLKQVIEDGDVLVGGRTEKPAYKLRAGETIELETPAPLAADFQPEDIPLDIVHEDDALVVVNKRAGMVVHPAASVPAGTLANALAFRFRIADFGLRNEKTTGTSLSSDNPQSAIRNPQYPRPGIVHRLDRDTSGLMVVARTEAAHEHLADQFRARTVFKSYVALVHGQVRADEGRIDQPIARDPRQRARMGVVRAGRPALSLYRVRRRYERFTLLDVEIKTGRTHQIRVHLAWLKHPVVGDKIYGGGRDQTIPGPRMRAAVAALGRQFLHAERLAFNHPLTGERMQFSAPPPADLTQLLNALEQS